MSEDHSGLNGRIRPSEYGAASPQAAVVAARQDLVAARLDVMSRQAALAAAPASQHSSMLSLDERAILASIGEVAYAWDIEADTLQWGTNALHVIQPYEPERLKSGRGYASLLDPGGKQNRWDAVMSSTAQDVGHGVPYIVEYCLLPQGHNGRLRLWVEDQGRWYRGANGKPARAQGVIRPINDRHARDEELSFLSMNDPLTGQINRNRLTQVLSDALEAAKKTQALSAFLLVKIDNLSSVNEAFGYEVTDQVIAGVAQRLRSKMRGGDTLGRYSSNRFGVVLHSCSEADIYVAAERLLASVRDDVIITQKGPVAVTVSIGGVLMPRHGRTISEIMLRAEESLAAARVKLRDHFVLFSQDVTREESRHVNISMSNDIIDALNARRVKLAFQPVLDAKTKEVAFYECLVRADRADGTPMDVRSFITVAEKLGLVRLIDHRVLELALSALQESPDLILAINISALTSGDKMWMDTLEAACRRADDVGRRLIIEITETAAIHDVTDVCEVVQRLRDLGCRIAIDDFGSGHTSLRQLKTLQVDEVKIDGSYIEALEHNVDDQVYVKAMIELAHQIGVKVVAEWVVSEAAEKLLLSYGIDYLQGYLYAPASFERPWLKKKIMQMARANA